MKSKPYHSRYRPLIEDVLEKYEPALGDDLRKYRNHVYRVFYNCLMRDRRRAEEDKYAIAAVFHDLGIWTADTLDYLPPSKAMARDYLHAIGRPEWTDEVLLMIQWHHKVRPYRGRFSRSVETFRKADWADVSLGFLSFGLPRKQLMANRLRFPTEGFHLFLLRRIVRNFFSHPLRPLPMFRF